MRRAIGVLAVLLVAQVGLAIVLNYHGSRLSEAPAEVALFDFAPDNVDRVTIEGPAGEKTVLARAGGSWQLPGQNNFPADAKKVDNMLEKLLGLKEGLPVATSEGALDRFKLADNGYERRITLAKGDKTLGTLYLGTSQGTRAVHGRRADQDAVYQLSFAIYGAPAGTDDWIDKAVLQLPKDDIATIDVDGLHLVSAVPDATKPDATADSESTSTAKADDESSDVGTTGGNATKPAEPAWQLADPGDAKLNSDAADKLVGLLAELRISSVLGTEEKPEYGLDKPKLSLSLTRKNGAKIDYNLGKAPDKDDYTLKTSTRPEYFKIASYSAEELVKAATRDALLEMPAETNHHAAVEPPAGSEPTKASN